MTFPTYKNVTAPDLSNLIALQSQGANNAFSGLANIGNTIQGIQQKNIDRDNRNLLAQGMLAKLNQDPNAVKNIFDQAVSDSDVPVNLLNVLGKDVQKINDSQQKLNDQKNLFKLNLSSPTEQEIFGKDLIENSTTLLPEEIINTTADTIRKNTEARNLLDGSKVIADSTDTVNPENTASNIVKIPENSVIDSGITKQVSDIILKSPQVKQEEENKKYALDQTYQSALENAPIYNNSETKFNNQPVFGPQQLDSLESFAISTVLAPLSKQYTSDLDAVKKDSNLTEQQKIQKIGQVKKDYESSLAINSANFKNKYNIPDDVISNLFSSGLQFNSNGAKLNSTKNVLNIYNDTLKQLTPNTNNSLITKKENEDIYAQQQSRIDQSLYMKNASENSNVYDTEIDTLQKTKFKNVTNANDVGAVFALNTDRSSADSAKQTVSNVQKELEEDPHFKSLNKKVNVAKLSAIVFSNRDPQTTLLGIILGDGIGNTDSILNEGDALSKAQYLASEDPLFKTQLDKQKNKISNAHKKTEQLNNELTKLENKLLVERENGVSVLKTFEQIKQKKELYDQYVKEFSVIKNNSRTLAEDYLKERGFVKSGKPKEKEQNINNDPLMRVGS